MQNHKILAKTVVITGGSSGLGEALAVCYAQPGHTLGLLARRNNELERVAQRCRDKGATVEVGVVDITDSKAVARWVQTFDAKHNIDLLIANAGVFTGHGPHGNMETVDDITWVLRTNLEGVAITIAAALPMMRERERGRIAIIGSLCGLQPQADAPAYSASKAGVMSYGEALREFLIPDNVAVSLIYPGHIETAQAKNHVGALPGLISADRAAAHIKKKLDKGRSFIAFPWSLLQLIRAGRCIHWRMRARFGQGFRFHVSRSQLANDARRHDAPQPKEPMLSSAKA